MSIPVLAFHHVSPCRELKLNVTPDVFESQMKYLHDRGYRTLAPGELVQYLRGGPDPGKKTVLITFDDGWQDNCVFAYPVLQKYRLNASIFIITGLTEEASDRPRGGAFTERYARLSWEEIREMAGGGLIGVYSHTISHASCKDMAEEGLKAELEGSKRAIEERLNAPCPYICWPYGKSDDKAVEAARRAGYAAMFTMEAGVVRKGSDPFAISRNRVSDNVFWFRLKMRIWTAPRMSGIYFRLRRRLTGLKRLVSLRPRPQEL